MKLLCPSCHKYVEDVFEQDDIDEDTFEIVINCPHCKAKLKLRSTISSDRKYFLKLL